MTTPLTVYQSKVSTTNYITTVAPDTANGNAFVNTGRERLYIQTSSASGITPVITPVGKLEGVLPVASPYASIRASKLVAIGPFKPADYNDISGNVTVTWIGASGTVVVWVDQLPAIPQ